MKKVYNLSKNYAIYIYIRIDCSSEDINWSMKFVLYTDRLWCASEIPQLCIGSVTNVTKNFTNDIYSKVFCCKHCEHQ